LQILLYLIKKRATCILPKLFKKSIMPTFSKHSPNVGDTAEFMFTVSLGNIRYLDASPSASIAGNSRLLLEICRLYWSTIRNLLDR
jgi:hypothetical protein